MKKVLIILQVAVFGLFLHNTGIFGLLSRIPHVVERVDALNDQKLRQFMKEKVDEAKKKGTGYSPACYFQDEIDIEVMKKKLPHAFVDPFLNNELMNLETENFRNGTYGQREIDTDREKFKDFLDPGREGREQIKRDIAQKTFWPKVGKAGDSLLFWLLTFYFKGLPLAFALFLIWWYKEYQTIRIRNPLSFLISVVAYPYVIGKIVYEWTREEIFSIYLEAELRRTKERFFTLLSADEIADIRRFAKSNFGRKHFLRRLRLGGMGLRHSFGSAIAATLLLSFVSVIVANLQAETLTKSECQNSSLIQTDESPPVISVFESGAPDEGNILWESAENAAVIAINFFYGAYQRIILEIILAPTDPFKKIEHIPVVG